MNSHLSFIKHFLKSPSQVGALTAFNKHVAQKISKYLKSRDYSSPCRILEVGAGTGGITRAIVSELCNHDTLDLVEIDPDCCAWLEKEFDHLPGVRVFCQSIVDWKPSYQYDFILSTLPFNSLDKKLVNQILVQYEKISAPGCLFSYVEYAWLARLGLLFGKKKNKEMLRQRRRNLKHYQSRLLIEKDYVARSFLPCHIYHMNMGRGKSRRPSKSLANGTSLFSHGGTT